MIDHIEIRTRQIEASTRFYADVLAPLGYSQRVQGAVRGFGDGDTLDMFIGEGEPSANVHYAFAVPDRATVERIYRLAEEAGHTLDRAPALAPQIHANYYAGYLRDPDGHLIEFVCQRPE